jgi:hypothetical protein
LLQYANYDLVERLKASEHLRAFLAQHGIQLQLRERLHAKSVRVVCPQQRDTYIVFSANWDAATSPSSLEVGVFC